MNKDVVPPTPGARRLALSIFVIAAVAGGLAIWWLTASLDELSELARRDADAAIALFKRRVLPAFIVTVLVGVAGGLLLMRQGLSIVRTGEFPPQGWIMIRDTPAQRGGAAKAIGWVLTMTGFLLAAVPLITLALILWLLRSA